MTTISSHVYRRPDDVGFSVFEEFHDEWNQLPSLMFKTSSGDSDPYGEDNDVFAEKIPHEDRLNHFKETIDALNNLIKEPVSGKREYHNYYSEHSEGLFKFPTFKILVHITCNTANKSKIVTSIGIYGDGSPANDAMFEQIKAWALTVCPPPVKDKTDEINIISQDSQGGFRLISVKMTSKINTFSYDHYNEDFEKVSERIIKDLTIQNDSGLVLLHGSVGSGKTSYLKHLLRVIKNKKIIYVPPDLISSLSSPHFISFLMDYGTNSILLVEDAENVLLRRDSGGNQSVSNILNISNGILGDVLKMQIICTFNCPLDHVDPALLRPGRLIAEYDFQNLSPDRTEKLMTSLYGNDVVYSNECMSLAEIFNHDKLPEKTEVTERVIGFMPTT